MTTTIKTRTKAPLALVAGIRTGAPRIVGYAYAKTPRVIARARRLGARLLPVTGGAVEVPMEGVK